MKDVTHSANPPNKQTRFNRHKKRVICYTLAILAWAVYYYVVLPPIHIASMSFWLFLLVISGTVLVIEIILDSFKMRESSDSFFTDGKLPEFGKKYRNLFMIWGSIIVIGGLLQLILSPVFFAKQYANMIQYQEGNFAKEFPETDLNQIPLVDRDTAIRLGNRQLGSLTDLVSQFEPAEDYTQININNHPYRVTPLQYVDFFRWLNNYRTGIPNYIQVDNVTGEVAIKQPPSPIKYSQSDLFNRNVMRRLRFNFPFSIFDSPSFEVDDVGNPYYIATTYRRHFVLREPEPNGVILLNAMNGETTHYSIDQIPQWVDRVYKAEIIMHQIQMHGRYSGGFWNALFAKKGVVRPTEGYNYIPMNDDLFLYTGLTSVSGDESNIGFILVNLRTKETKMYPLTAAEEFSAMKSAEGSVQEKEYKASFPLLINIAGKPLYVLTLKDNSGLIKEYALIDAQNYQDVTTAPKMSDLIQKFAASHDIKNQALQESSDVKEITGKIDQIQAVVIDGNTAYYFMIDGQVYTASIELNKSLPFVKPGDQVTFKAIKDGQVVKIDLNR